MQTIDATDVREFVIANFLFGRAEPLDDDASFMDEGLIDSTGILQLVTYLEETYAIEIDEDELIPDNLDSIKKVRSYLGRKLGERTTAALV